MVKRVSASCALKTIAASLCKRAASLCKLKLCATALATSLPSQREGVAQKTLRTLFVVAMTTHAAASSVLMLRPRPGGVALYMALKALAAGCMSEDGLADWVDASAKHSKRQALSALKAPGVGAFGGCALALALALEYQALTSMPASDAITASFVGASHGALAMAWHWATTAHAYDDQFVKPSRANVMAWSAATFASSWAACGLKRSLLLMATQAALVAGMNTWTVCKLGGRTGDSLGAVRKAMEVASLMAWTNLFHKS
ncbi:putative cobalamin 5'-phosphate synthase [Candidatus Hodgkinia cicadicola Dsem]|nr:putative cobalamin 5'-phosphate synthase [Candidatus Hodgkinia cicadicola Dsem]